MGLCIYCGKPAGFLRTRHRECTDAHFREQASIVQMSEEALVKTTDLATLDESIKAALPVGHLKPNEIPPLLITAWDNAVKHYLEHGPLTEDAEAHLHAFTERFGLQPILDRDALYMVVVKSAVLRELTEGKVPNRCNLTGPVPFNFAKDEKLIWVFNGVNYYKEKTRRQYAGHSSGASIRIAKGVYYRTSAFRGAPIDVNYVSLEDRGALAVTNKEIYFAGPHKSFRQPFKKIVTIVPYNDGVGFTRDTASARPETLQTSDGWFTYNLFENVARLHA
jgi:hypothetical protein